jgi:hypothetical protein
LRIRPRSVALVSLFAALDAVIRLIPFTPAIGLNLVFDFGWAFSPVMGMLLGAVFGFAAAFLGSVILSSLALYPWTFGIASLFTFGISALQAGLLASRRSRSACIIVSSALLLVPSLIWTLLIWNTLAVWVTAYYVVGFFGIVVLWRLGSSSDMSYGRSLLIETVLIAYAANVTQHVIGNILCVLILNLKPEVFFAAMPLTAIEQTVFALTAAGIAYPIVRIFRKKAITISEGGVF